MVRKSNEPELSQRQLLESEWSRILTAAVVSRTFCESLLKNPASAISEGYAGEQFHLGIEEKRRLSSIRATTLADFARQLSQVQSAGFGYAD